MVKRESTAPFLFFILDLPSGISSGFASITLPFILTQAGFSVAVAGYIVALGVSANLWRFLWGPVADFTLSARRWYLIGLVTTAVTLLLLGLIPLRPDSTGLLNADSSSVIRASAFQAIRVTFPFPKSSATAFRPAA